MIINFLIIIQDTMGYVFISYSSKNQEDAYAMNLFLKKQNIKTWMAPMDIPIGSQYIQVINKAIKECSCMILLWSNEAQESQWVSREVERAIHYGKNVIPVQLGEVIINDAFEFYISVNQIIAVKKIEEKSEEMKKVLESVKVYTEYNNKSTNDIFYAGFYKDTAVIGMGGCGCNIVNRNLEKQSYKRKFVAHYNQSALECCKVGAENKKLLYDTTSVDDIFMWMKENVKEQNVLLLCGLGGISSSYISMFAKAAKQLDKKVIVFSFLPFSFEDPKRKDSAKKHFDEIMNDFDNIDYFMYLKNDGVMNLCDRKTSMPEVLVLADYILWNVADRLREVIQKTTIQRFEVQVLKGAGIKHKYKEDQNVISEMIKIVGFVKENSVGIEM